VRPGSHFPAFPRPAGDRGWGDSSGSQKELSARTRLFLTQLLADVFARINDHAIHRLDQLLPWNWKTHPARLAA
jgi:hypothetical protein